MKKAVSAKLVDAGVIDACLYRLRPAGVDGVSGASVGT